MSFPSMPAAIDERFLTHRLKSTSIGGQAAIAVAAGLWFYRHFNDHIWSWDLFAVIATMALVKVVVLIWYRLRD
jgi:hypothetical protein